MFRRNAVTLTLSLTSTAVAQPLPQGSSSLTQAAADGAAEAAHARIRSLADASGADLFAPAAEPPPGLQSPLADAHESPAPPVTLSPAARATWSACALDGDVEPVEVRPGALLAVQLAFSRRGQRVVALVTLGRPGGAQRGMSYPASRLVTWTGDRYIVSEAPGAEPDAQIALGDGEISVLGYARADDETAPRPLTLSHWSIDGRNLSPRVELANTVGLRIDSALVAWRGGLAVVLGRPPTSADQDRRTEALYFFDVRGRSLRAPLELTRDTRDDALGTLRAGLTSLDDGATLTATWAVDGPDGGVWARRGITLSATPAAEHVSGRETRPLWAPQPTPWGVLYQRAATGQDGALAEVIFTPWQHAGNALMTGRFWDPLLAYSNGGWITAGLSPRTPPTDAPPGDGTSGAATVPEIAFTARDGSRNRSVGAPRDSIGAMTDAVDIAIGPTPTGAIVGWIESDADEAPGAVRRVMMARVSCTAR